MENSKPDTNFHVQLQTKINELCYKVFYNFEDGKELLRLLEWKHFRSPVAFPNKEASWAYFNEGQNELIRSFTASIHAHMNEQQKTANPKSHKRKV